MADPRERAAKLASKLIRTAASKSAADNERQIAAIQAAELIVEHELSIVVDEKEVDRKTRERQERRQRRQSTNIADMFVDLVKQAMKHEPTQPQSPYDWREVVAMTDVKCVQCGDLIPHGESCWFAADKGFIHYDITCAEHT